MTTSLILTSAISGASITLSSLLVKGGVKLFIRILRSLKRKFVSFIEGIIFRIGKHIERKR